MALRWGAGGRPSAAAPPPAMALTPFMTFADVTLERRFVRYAHRATGQYADAALLASIAAAAAYVWSRAGAAAAAGGPSAWTIAITGSPPWAQPAVVALWACAACVAASEWASDVVGLGWRAAAAQPNALRFALRLVAAIAAAVLLCRPPGDGPGPGADGACPVEGAARDPLVREALLGFTLLTCSSLLAHMRLYAHVPVYWTCALWGALDLARRHAACSKGAVLGVALLQYAFAAAAPTAALVEVEMRQRRAFWEALPVSERGGAHAPKRAG